MSNKMWLCAGRFYIQRYIKITLTGCLSIWSLKLQYIITAGKQQVNAVLQFHFQNICFTDFTFKSIFSWPTRNRLTFTKCKFYVKTKSSNNMQHFAWHYLSQYFEECGLSSGVQLYGIQLNNKLIIWVQFSPSESYYYINPNPDHIQYLTTKNCVLKL